MRYTVVTNDSIKQYFSLKGTNVEPLFEKRVNRLNTVIIDKKYTSDITLGFPNYIFEVYKIISSYRRDRIEKVFELNYNLIYNKKPNEKFMDDLIILLRRFDYQKFNMPYVSDNGKIRIMLSQYSENIANSMKLNRNVNAYIKLRTIIFNTTILPYLKTILF